MGGRHSTRGIQGWKDHLMVGFASVLYLGYAPVASGTFGSLPAIPVVLWLAPDSASLLLLAAVLFALGTAASGRVARVMGQEDPGQVTIDEFVGMIVAFLWLPITWSSVPLVFVLYRAFDIAKPFPARRCERIEGGLGIMLDDVVAGIYANVAFRLLWLVFR